MQNKLPKAVRGYSQQLEQLIQQLRKLSLNQQNPYAQALAAQMNQPWHSSSISASNYPPDQRSPIEIPTVRTLTESFRASLDLPADKHNDARVVEVLDHMAKLFQQAIQKPELVGQFHSLWEKVKNAPRVDGKIVLGDEITSEITIDKIAKW